MQVKIKLTRRQEEFVHNLLALHEEWHGPVHYSVVAERLGVSPFTAYDMLRLLEEKGLVTSEYQLAPGKSGPGRAERLFRPTEAAMARRQRLQQEAGVDSLRELRQVGLDRIPSWSAEDEELGRELLARIPPTGQGPIRYCVEVMTIIALRLRRDAGRQILLEYLPEILPDGIRPTRANLCMLGGFAFGIRAQEDPSDQEWAEVMRDHVRHYLDIVVRMSPEERSRLGEYLADMFAPMAEAA